MQVNSASLNAAMMAGKLRPAARQNTAAGAFAAAATQASTQADSASAGGPIGLKDAEEPQSLVNRIMQHWGSSDADSDLNTDGTVDARDLAEALNRQQSAAEGAGHTGKVLDTWGNSGGATDLNGDGTVDARDLAEALNGTTAGRSTSAPAPGKPAPEEVVKKIVDATFAARDADGDGTLVADEFGKNGKSLFARIDLDKSGGVQRQELGKAILADFNKLGAKSKGVSPDAFANRWMAALTGDGPAPNVGQFQRMQELFAKQPSQAHRAAYQPSILSVRA
jgi:Ca2+-binding EF-hand superfamily protein